MLLGHWVKLEWLELMEMWTRTTRIGFLETLAFPVIPVALAACHLPDDYRDAYGHIQALQDDTGAIL